MSLQAVIPDPETAFNNSLPVLYPIIAKNPAVGAPCRRESRLKAAPTRPDQKLTSGEFQKQHVIVIASCKSWGEIDCQAVIYATVGFTFRPWLFFNSYLDNTHENYSRADIAITSMQVCHKQESENVSWIKKSATASPRSLKI